MDKQKWYFSFGTGRIMRDHMICIEGTFDEARKRMLDDFGKKWCGQYDEEKAKEMIEKYGYTVIEAF